MSRSRRRGAGASTPDAVCARGEAGSSSRERLKSAEARLAALAKVLAQASTIAADPGVDRPPTPFMIETLEGLVAIGMAFPRGVKEAYGEVLNRLKDRGVEVEGDGFSYRAFHEQMQKHWPGQTPAKTIREFNRRRC